MRKAAVALVALAAVTIALCMLAPLRPISGDTVPARYGGLTLHCGGDFDLSRVDWLHADNVKLIVAYYQLADRTGQFPSVFGPAPAVVASLTLLDFGEGESMTDHSLRIRERAAAAWMLALAAILLALACRARTTTNRALAAAAIAVLSFAGAATLGQGLWQATVALPPLMAGLALVAWRDRIPRLILAAPAVLLLAVMIRPNVAPLAVGIGAMWALEMRGRKNWLIAIGIAAITIAPLVAYNAFHYNSPLPIGQWIANKRDNGGHVFNAASALKGIAGLLVSPSRGIVWFAPLAIVGALRAPRPIAIAIALQLILMAAFFKWHGGQAFGPRLLSEATWLALYGACTLRARILAPLAAMTIVVGQLGLWLYRPEQWEARRRPESHPSAFWDIGDNPIFATLGDVDPKVHAPDAPPIERYRCEHGRIITEQ
jgi:hypothetical protein